MFSDHSWHPTRLVSESGGSVLVDKLLAFPINDHKLHFFLSFLNGFWLPSDCHMTGSHDHDFCGEMAKYDRQNMCENAIEIEAKSRE